MTNCVAGGVEEVETSIAEIVEGVEAADLETLRELDFAELAPFKIGV
jgi:hypothetical protein